MVEWVVQPAFVSDLHAFGFAVKKCPIATLGLNGVLLTFPYGAICCVWLDDIQNGIAADSHVFVLCRAYAQFGSMPSLKYYPPCPSPFERSWL